MRPILIILVGWICLTACESHTCKEAVSHYKQYEKERNEKKSKADELSVTLEKYDLEDSDQLQQEQLVEDEMLLLLTDVALCEIEMETIKKNNFHCF
jgi:hypothetical protein